jgi:hypothetical protein
MDNKVNPDRESFIKDLQEERAKYQRELSEASATNDEVGKKAASFNLKNVENALKRYGVNISEDNSKMADGGMARGKGNREYQHNYATGGSVTDHLKKVPEKNSGLKKLPTEVRNKMGYMARGGVAKKKK